MSVRMAWFVGGKHGLEADLYFKKVLWWPIDFFEALLAGIWHRLHGGEGGEMKNGGRIMVGLKRISFVRREGAIMT